MDGGVVLLGNVIRDFHVVRCYWVIILQVSMVARYY